MCLTNEIINQELQEEQEDQQLQIEYNKENKETQTGPILTNNLPRKRILKKKIIYLRKKLQRRDDKLQRVKQ